MNFVRKSLGDQLVFAMDIFVGQTESKIHAAAEHCTKFDLQDTWHNVTSPAKVTWVSLHLDQFRYQCDFQFQRSISSVSKN